MAFANSSRTQLAIIEEATWATTPAAAFKAIRFTTDDLVNEINKVQSEEIRPDQNISDLIKVSEMTSGGFSFEVSYSDVQDMLFEGALTSDFSGAISLPVTGLEFIATDNSINDSGNGLSVIVPYQWYRITGASTNPSEMFAQALVVTGGSKVTMRGPTFLNETVAGSTLILSSGTMKNATTEKSYTIEKGFLDIGEYYDYPGQKVNTFSMDLTAADKITGSVSFMGEQAINYSSSQSTGAVIAAATTPITTASGNVVSILEDYGATSLDIRSFNLSIDRNLDPLQTVGKIYPVEINRGYCSVTGNLTIYFEDDTYFQKAKNNTSFSFTYGIKDNSGNTYLITLPNVKLQNFPVTIPAINQPIEISADFQAILDPTTSCSIQIDKFDALP